jgi:hypothetical protein
MISMSEGERRLEVGVTSAAASAVASAVEEEGMSVDLVVAGCDVEEEDFFDALAAGRRGHARESWPTSLQRGQAFSEPGQDARTLKPKRSKKGVAERDLPTGTFNTMSQRLVSRGRPLYVCGAMATISPWVDQKERSVCSMTGTDSTGTFTSFIGTYWDGVPAGGTG